MNESFHFQHNTHFAFILARESVFEVENKWSRAELESRNHRVFLAGGYFIMHDGANAEVN